MAAIYDFLDIVQIVWSTYVTGSYANQRCYQDSITSKVD